VSWDVRTSFRFAVGCVTWCIASRQALASAPSPRIQYKAERRTPRNRRRRLPASDGRCGDGVCHALPAILNGLLGTNGKPGSTGATGASGPNGNHIAPCGCHASNNTYILSVLEALHLG
jgi:hypothetical protein